MSASSAEVGDRAAAAGIRLTIVSALAALLPYGGDVLRGNEQAVAAVEQRRGLRFWAVLDPRKVETYRQVEQLLSHPMCAGIKLHPHAHVYDIRTYGEETFAFAAERRALVLTHSGDVGSYPEDFVPFVDRYPEVRLILAHLGNSDDGSPARQVFAITHARHGNLWVDTSSMRSMMAGLIEWAVAQIGADRLLFGTDTPLYAAAAQKARIEAAEIDPADKRAILSGNAERLLGSVEGFTIG